MLNHAVIQGRLTADPELKTTTNGVAVMSFSVAVERNYVPQGQERLTDFISCVAWRNTAEFIKKYFGKGQMIIVEGHIETRQYEDRNGNKRTAVELNAERIHFSGKKESNNAPQAEPQAATQDYTPIDDDQLPF